MFIQNMKQKRFIINTVISTFAAALTSTQCFALPADSGIEARVAESTYQMATATNRIIVKYRNGSSGVVTTAEAMDRTESISFMAGTDLQYMHQLAGNADVLALDKSIPIEEMQAIADRISADPDVLYAEPDLIMHAYAFPDDPMHDQQWHYFEADGGINLPDASDISTGSDVTVAVIDTGILLHADLNGQVLPGYDFISNPNMAIDGNGRDADPTDEGDWWQPGTCGPNDPGRQSSSWHGTHVAGTVAARSNNGFGVAGVAWNAKILPVRVLGRCGGRVSDITDAMRWSVGLAVPGVPQNPNPAKVLNLSLGGPGQCSKFFLEAIEAARAAGATVVIAAGNEGADASQFSPGNCPGVITVAANKRDGGRAYYSNFGETIDITAPGGETFDPVLKISTPEKGILSTLNSGSTTAGNDSYGFRQGTSMAAPHVAGAAALLYALDSNLTPDEVKSILTQTARSFPAVSERQCDTTLCGAGILDAFAAVNEIDDVTPKPGSNLLENDVPIDDLGAGQDGMIHYQMEVPAGATDLSFSISGGKGDADLYVKFGKAPSMNDFDYRPYLVGNTESVEVESVQPGTYYIMLHGYESFSGVSLVGQYLGSDKKPQTNIFTNENDVQIPDGNLGGVFSSIDVPMSGDSGVITIDIDIKHSYRGDLFVRLIAPNGASVVIKEINYWDGQPDFQTTVRLDASGIEASGQWSLQVVDVYFGGAGYIDRWSIIFE